MSKHGTLKDNEGNKVYPNAYYKIGDIFITTNEENPATRFGGTWQKLPNETFLMTASSKHKVKSTGGENEVILTIDEIPSHRHDITQVAWNSDDNTDLLHYESQTQGSTSMFKTSYTGGGQPHNNMPKFYAVYIWIRVA